MNSISSKIKIVHEDISKIDTEIIVNAAKPTLMGGSGVDGAIHKRVNDKNGDGFLKEEILKKFDDSGNENYPRINYGDLFITDGYECWKKIYHAVGIKSDEQFTGFCSKGKIDILKHLYKKIFVEFKNSGYRSIAVPIISSGSYGLDERIARRIAYASTYNFLLDLKKKNKDIYEYIDTVFLVTNDKSIYDKYIEERSNWDRVLKNSDEMLYLSRKDSRESYKSELKSEKNGLVKWIRLGLFELENLSLIYWISSHSDISWNTKRRRKDVLVLIQLLLSIIMLAKEQNISLFFESKGMPMSTIDSFLSIIACYFIFEILISNSKLFFFTNINNKSKNRYRSLVLFMCNYITIVLSFAIIFKTVSNLSGLSRLKYSVFIESWDKITSTGEVVLILEKTILCYLGIVGLTMILDNFYERKFKA